MGRRQAHFECDERLWGEFLEAIKVLRYTSASEYLRQCIREAIEKSESRINKSQETSNGKCSASEGT